MFPTFADRRQPPRFLKIQETLVLLTAVSARFDFPPPTTLNQHVTPARFSRSAGERGGNVRPRGFGRFDCCGENGCELTAFAVWTACEASACRD